MFIINYADNYSVSFSLNAHIDKSSETQLDGAIAPGKKMHGWIGWEVPADWSEMDKQQVITGGVTAPLTFKAVML